MDLERLRFLFGEGALDHFDDADLDDETGRIEMVEQFASLPDVATIVGRLLDVARSQPGITAADHVDAVVTSLGAGGASVESMVDRVLEELVDGPLHWLPGDRTAVVADLIDGTTFTHRLTDSELELGVVSAAFDLGAFARIDELRLVDGTELEQFSVDEHHLAWRGPAGWLNGVEPGTLLAFSVTLDAGDRTADEPIGATVTIDTIADEPACPPELVEMVRAGYDELVAEPGLPVDGSALSWWLLFHRPGLFATAQPPLAEVCAATGLELRAGQVAHDEQVWRNDVNRRRWHAVFDMVPETRWRRVLSRAIEVLDDPDASVDEVRSVLDDCAEPEALDVLADVLFGHYLDVSDEFDRDRADAPGRLFELVERATAGARRPREVAVAEYLACVLYERCAEPDIAESHLRRAGEAQPLLGPVAERLGWYRYDRGDAHGAMRWWRELSEMPAAADTIRPFLSNGPGGAKLGRNDSCWCGSGRKFKRCHQDATDLAPLPDRVGWLCRKATLWLEHSTGDVRDTVAELMSARATGDPDPGPWHLGGSDAELLKRAEHAARDPIVIDAALHEGGLFALFLQERGALLPDDEQLLAASWQTIERSVHEVVVVDPGVSMTLHDLATGDAAEVRERTASTQAAVGERYCARVVPDGSTHQIIGATFPVRTGHEAAVLDLCATGDPFELCAWVGRLHQPPQLVHTPGLAEQMIDRDAVEAVLAALGDDADPDAIDAALRDELTRQAQTGWLDERIPALDHLTPRQAAADPTRLEQLERLLTELEPRHQPDLPDGFETVTYDVAALRHELGLD